MSKVLITAMVISAVLAGGDIARARNWCLAEPGAQLVSCVFHTFAQCQASRPGGSTFCYANPDARSSHSSPDSPDRSARARRR